MKAGLIVGAVAAAYLGSFLAVSDLALARGRNARTGFNFGTTVRALSDQERTHAGEGSDKNTKVRSESQLINPYLGYSFGPFNLGLVYSTEQSSSESVETTEDGSKTLTRKLDGSGKGASLFARFLFGKVFFFEAAGGVYQERATVKTESKVAQADGSFVGSEDSYVVKGTGPGYHLGGGVELPMGDGFYFTGCYQARIVQLRDYDGGSDLGQKRSQEQKREVLFGIAYYDR